MSRTILLLATIVATSLGTPAFAEYRNMGLISDAEARRYGLERTWFTHVAVDPSRGRINHILHFVSSVDTFAVFEVKYGERKRLFSGKAMDRFGDVYGREGAERAAKSFAKSLKAESIESTTETHEIPEITLYVTTDRGMVHAIDGETGRTVWTSQIGKSHYPTERPSASEQYLSVVNGAFVYLIKRKTGEVAWVRKTMGVPGAGPALTDEFVAVPMIKGNVELYDIEETRTLPKIYKSNGRALVQPTVTSLSVAWPTDRGFLYVARANKNGVRYRLEAKDTIVSPATFFEPSQFFASSIDGYVYNVHEISGVENWRFSTGEAISNSPIPVGKSVYVVTDKRRLFCVDMETGEEKWWAPHVKRFIAASRDRLYCVSELDRLVIIDAKTGGRVATMNIDLLDLQYENIQTDRIFLGTKTGIIQCLKEPAMEFPLVHAAVAEAEQKRRPDIIQQEEPAPEDAPPAQPKPPAGNNPFGGAGNPFGGGNQGGNQGGGNQGGNPFGGSANPFGGGGNQGGGNQGGGNQGGGNPFGGGANPFGGGGANPFGGGNPGAGNQGGGAANPFGGNQGGNQGGGNNPFGGANPF